MRSSTQLALFGSAVCADPVAPDDGFARERPPFASWRWWDPGERGGFNIMFRLPNDPQDGEGGDADRRLAARAEGKSGGDLYDEAKALKGRKSQAEVEALAQQVVDVLYADGRPRTLHHLGMQLLGKGGDIVAGSILEEACWRLVRAKGVKWGSALAASTFRHRRPGRLCLRRPRQWERVIVFAPWCLGAQIDDPFSPSELT